MINNFLKLILGDLDEKRAYKQCMKRADALPEDYRFAFRKIKQYMYANGVGADGDLTLFADLVDLFEAGAADGRHILDITGPDVSGFCDEFMRGSVTYTDKQREQLNQEILDKFKQEGK
ncbi:DUF1048 domain-containing protein [Paenibacillus sp. MMS20-IR301]|uniref:DUF1048 domain-containing protein n=1 Tax=Paenibacillus sp. MMS20-IR301 TaxID=2895946 RepID=UPI0028F14277|nr:DUF1048 domain-containing protein [Paenibacillus sp. MMS20-IR301]WNS46074.1 DUF1048 domain-containing protein [Paenibacillus sp. MMS20-IR301]